MRQSCSSIEDMNGRTDECANTCQVHIHCSRSMSLSQLWSGSWVRRSSTLLSALYFLRSLSRHVEWYYVLNLHSIALLTGTLLDFLSVTFSSSRWTQVAQPIPSWRCVQVHDDLRCLEQGPSTPGGWSPSTSVYTSASRIELIDELLAEKHFQPDRDLSRCWVSASASLSLDSDDILLLWS